MSDQLTRFVKVLRGGKRKSLDCETLAYHHGKELAAEIELLQRENAIYREALEAYRSGHAYVGYYTYQSSTIAVEAIRLADAERDAGKDGGA